MNIASYSNAIIKFSRNNVRILVEFDIGTIYYPITPLNIKKPQTLFIMTTFMSSHFYTIRNII